MLLGLQGLRKLVSDLPVLGESPAMQAVFIQRAEEAGFATKTLFETCLPRVIHNPIHENLQL